MVQLVTVIKAPLELRKKPMRKPGFTLAELLIALAILGVIAAFTIPKILTAQQDEHRMAVIKETIASINQIVYVGYKKGEMRNGYNGSYVMANINAYKICSTNSSTEGCFTHTITPEAVAEFTQPGFILHNGATLTGFNNVAGPSNGFCLDWNGPQGPNLAGEDQMALIFCYGASGCINSGRAGTVYARSDANPLTWSLYTQVFK